VSSGRSIIFCEQPRSPNWRVAVPASGSVCLIGWTDSASTVDDGMPDWVAEILATALTAQHVVTFPATSKVSTSAERVTELSTGIVKHALTGTGPRRFALVSTQRPDITRSAFDDTGFPWWLQGQFLLLTPQDAAPPQLDADEVLALLAPDPTDPDAWSLPGVVAQLRAGVDGDVGALYGVSASVTRLLITNIESAASAQGVGCRQLSEAAFVEALAGAR